MQLSEAVNNQDLTMQELWEFLQYSEVNISFWGSRLLSVRGYEGRVNLAIFAQQLNHLTSYWHFPETMDQLNLSDRSYGIKSANLIEEYYQESDRMIEVAHLLTRIFNFFQELFNLHGDSTIWHYSSRFPYTGGAVNDMIVTLQNVPKNIALEQFTLEELPSSWFNFEGERFIIDR